MVAQGGDGGRVERHHPLAGLALRTRLPCELPGDHAEGPVDTHPCGVEVVPVRPATSPSRAPVVANRSHAAYSSSPSTWRPRGRLPRRRPRPDPRHPCGPTTARARRPPLPAARPRPRPGTPSSCRPTGGRGRPVSTTTTSSRRPTRRPGIRAGRPPASTAPAAPNRPRSASPKRSYHPTPTTSAPPCTAPSTTAAPPRRAAASGSGTHRGGWRRAPARRSYRSRISVVVSSQRRRTSGGMFDRAGKGVFERAGAAGSGCRCAFLGLSVAAELAHDPCHVGCGYRLGAGLGSGGFGAAQRRLAGGDE